jgi:PncC family amidohydrolase
LSLARKLLRDLEAGRRTLAVAESFTGGRVQDHLTNIAGASKAYLGGVVAYDDAPKRKLLGVKAPVVRKFGAVSPEVAIQMAQGVRRLFGADVGIATTGIAGPGGARPKKPVGLSVAAIADRNRSVAEIRVFKGSRNAVKERGAEQAIQLAVRVLFPQPLRQPPRSRRT